MSTVRTLIIEGQPVQVVETARPIPQRLDTLLAQLFGVRVKEDIRPTGTATQCEQLRTHRFGILREGRHVGSDRVLRDLRLEMCRDCGAVCVRDISYDRVAGLTPGRRGPVRRDLILGWYSGQRRNAREYR